MEKKLLEITELEYKQIVKQSTEAVMKKWKWNEIIINDQSLEKHIAMYAASP